MYKKFRKNNYKINRRNSLLELQPLALEQPIIISEPTRIPYNNRFRRTLLDNL